LHIPQLRFRHNANRGLHYLETSRACNDGDLILMDVAGKNTQTTQVEIDKNYSVNGKFTTPKRKVYKLFYA